MNGMIDTAPVTARQWFMHTPHAVIGMGGNNKVRSIEPLPFEPVQDARTLHVAIAAGHDPTWELAAARLLKYLGSDWRFVVQESRLRSAAGTAAPQDVDAAEETDCLVLLGWPGAADRQLLKRIELHCRGGGSLVALRTLDAEMPGWPDFAEEVFGGRQPETRRSRLLEVRPSDIAWHHSIVAGDCPAWPLIAEGSVYRGPRLSPRATVLLTADDGRGQAPVAWAARREGGRVFCTTLGHEDDFREPAFLGLIARAIRWAGSGLRLR